MENGIHKRESRGATTYKGHSSNQGSMNGAFLDPLHLACFAIAAPLTLKPKEVAHQPISKDQLRRTGDQDMPNTD